MVEREAQASDLITAYKYGIISVVEAHGIQIIEDFSVVCLYFLAVFCLFFLICIAAERKIFCIPPFLRKLWYNSFNDLHLYVVIPVTFDFVPNL